MEIDKLIEDLRGLLKQYGEKIPYGELVGAPWPYSRAGDLVWQDPEPYFIEQAATALSTLQAENEKLRETVDKYATAARVIALHLKPFCDESLPYDEMIADAARKASDELEQVKKIMRDNGISMKRLTKYICGHAHGAEGIKDDDLTGSYCRGEFEATAIVDRLAAIEDILGDEYDLERLKEAVKLIDKLERK